MGRDATDEEDRSLDGGEQDDGMRSGDASEAESVSIGSDASDAMERSDDEGESGGEEHEMERGSDADGFSGGEDNDRPIWDDGYSSSSGDIEATGDADANGNEHRWEARFVGSRRSQEAATATSAPHNPSAAAPAPDSSAEMEPIVIDFRQPERRLSSSPHEA